MSPSPVSSTPVLRTALMWGGIVAGILAVVGAIVGLLVGGTSGLASALAGVLVSALFLAVTAASILIANRWFADPLYVPIFFGIVLGGWLVKLVLFIVALVILRGQEWIDPLVFFVALVVSVVASLVVDVVVLLRMRVPAVSDTTLPTDPDAGDRRD
ncbi:hypothetical protein ACTU3I_11010 [Microbacterium sp. RD1]|uniref:hypothetical protein n=1 Tax=Microbacterium sp. RD1 TaxID=3457313 RepID=UPI003FA5B6C2